MTKNDLIMLVTTTSQDVSVNSVIPLTTITRRRGCALANTVSNTIIASKPGYYSVKGTVTFTAPVAGNATISLVKNNIPVEGVTSSETITTATTEVRTVPVSGIVRVSCNEVNVPFNLTVSGIAITVSNAELDFTYLG